MEHQLSLILFAAILLLAPGANNLLLLTSGAKFGIARTLPHMAGTLLGFLVMLVLGVAGLSGLLLQLPALAMVLKLVGAAWLARIAAPYLKRAMLGDSRTVKSKTTAAKRPFRFHEAALFQWANPSAFLITATIAASLSNTGATLANQLLYTCSTFVGVGAFATLVWAIAGRSFSRVFSAPRTERFANAVIGLLIVGAAGYILIK